MPAGPQSVTDFLSNVNDQLAAAAKIVGRSKHRQAIFEIIYRGPKQIKTIEEIRTETGLSQTHVLKEGGKMAGTLTEKVPGGYKKRKEFATRYKDILALARNKKKLARLPTKTSPNANSVRVSVTFPNSARNARQVTIDEIDSFSKVSKAKGSDNQIKGRLAEKIIKRGFASIIGERGTFRDWGGEKSDLYSTRVRLRGRRIAAAIAFKGKGTTGKLVPRKMGKNADQINRLFDEPAQLFLVVYHGQIDSAIISQMQAFAMGIAITGRKVYYGIVDGTDLNRIRAVYRQHFR
ncbi:MAG: hypothetical protein WA876_10940 [Candidatus Acidiferrales bacterium]